jgi:RHS repeat-associated protein
VTPGSGVCGADTMSYLYDPDGRRVARFQSGSLLKQYFYDAAGHMITEANSSGATLRAEIYAGSRHLATWNNGVTYFNHADWLGTERARTNSSGSVRETITSLPFGDGETTSGSCTPTFFTGKERDSETGLDNLVHRYYASGMGRMMSPDPVFISAARLADPQSLNLYAYVGNNPLSMTDPDGLDFYLACQTSDRSGCGHVTLGNGDEIWVQGRVVDNQFQATDVTMNKAGDPSAGYKDQWGNHYTGTFDDKNGVSFTNTATGDTSTHSRFFKGDEDRTTLMGSGAFSGIKGIFFSNCGGSCEARASLYETAPGAFAIAEAALHKQGGLMTAIDLLSGAHKPGAQWKDSRGYVHMLNPKGRMEMHFEGHPTGVGLEQFVLHMVGTASDAASGRAAAERDMPLP